MSDLARRQEHYPVGVRATLLPVRMPVFVDQVYKNPEALPVYEELVLKYGERTFRLGLPPELP
jgi:hypothetical protein